MRFTITWRNHHILMLKRYLRLLFNKAKKTKAKTSTIIQKRQSLKPLTRPTLEFTKRTIKVNPKPDNTTQGNINNARSKTKSSVAKMIDKQATNTQLTKKLATSDLNLSKTKNPTNERATKS